jgi:hypothetical protein
MKSLMVILLITYINLFVIGDNFGAKLYKNQLRGLHKEELERVTQEYYIKTFDSIFDKIIESAKIGETEYHFTIMCKELTNTNCEIHNGHQDWIQNHPKNIISITKSYITFEQHTTKLIDALKVSFPDSNITKIYKNCCDYHIIKW